LIKVFVVNFEDAVSK